MPSNLAPGRIPSLLNFAFPPFASSRRHPSGAGNLDASSFSRTLEPVVYLVDDDPAILESLRCLLESVGLRSEIFFSPTQFLNVTTLQRPGCIVLDLRMPEIGGLEVQAELTRRGVAAPIIFLTGYADVAVCAAAFRAGAYDFLEKPVHSQGFLGRVQSALEKDATWYRDHERRRQFWKCSETLTPREREVMDLLIFGQTLKQIALTLGISVQTAAKHRSHVLEKMAVSSDVGLVRRHLECGGPLSK